MRAKKEKREIWMRIWTYALEGSYTVEAALVIPIALFVMVFLLNLGIQLYMDTYSEIDGVLKAGHTDAMSILYRIQTIEGMKEVLK